MELHKGSNNLCTHLLCTSCLNKSIDTKLHEISHMECENCNEIILPEMYRDVISYDTFIKWVHASLNGDPNCNKTLLNDQEQENSTRSNGSSSKGKIKKGILVLPRVRISSRQHQNSKNTVVIPFSIGNSSFSFHISIRPQVNSRRQVKKEKVKSSRRVFTTFETGESSKSVLVPVSVSVPADEYFYCIICMENKPIDEMFWVMPCSHFFCNSCISNYITSKVEENTLSIPCPDPECQIGAVDPQSSKHTIPTSTFDQWTLAITEASLGLSKFYCPFSDCSGLLVREDEGEEITSAECPHCNRMFCVKCEVPWHGEMTCEEFGELGEDERGREDVLLRNLAVGSKWQRCPQCRMYVERISGCKFINCRCGYCFCYSCGAKMSKSNHFCTSCNS